MAGSKVVGFLMIASFMLAGASSAPAILGDQANRPEAAVMVDVRDAHPLSVRDCPDCPIMSQLPLPRGTSFRRPGEDFLYVSKYEVTWSEYLRAVDEAGCRPPRYLNGTLSDPKDRRLRDRVAVTGASLIDAICFTDWLSRRTKRSYRLPTSEEWEFAASAGSKSRFPWGADLGFNNAFVGSAFDMVRYPIKGFLINGLLGPRSPSNIREVGLLAPNAFGLFDVIGNARELTSSCLKMIKQASAIATEHECKLIVVKGGYNIDDADLRSYRLIGRDQADAGTGFRLVRGK